MSPPCPSESEILLGLLSDGARPTNSVALHLAGCKKCRERSVGLRRVVRGIAASANGAAAGGARCLDEDTLAEFLASGKDAAERSAHITHLTACGHCREELASLLALLGDPGVTTALGALERTRVRWVRGWRLIAAGLLAAVGISLVLPRRNPGDLLHRAPTITATPAPSPRFPRGDVPQAAALRWTAAPGANRYRVTLFDAEGHVRYQSQTTDTMAALPDSVTLALERSYLWKVEARTEVERWASSELVEFRVLRRGPP